jgi:uncharacterized protein YlxP (DUF503 family)
MYVAALRLTLRLSHVHSLKEKRAVVRRVKAVVMERMQLSAHEVDALDVWQTAVLGVAVVSSSKKTATEVADSVRRLISELGSSAAAFELTAEQRQWLHLDATEDQQLQPSGQAGFDVPSEWLSDDSEAT